jgi:uncharacterized membrane protein YbhN (UPF0104 family)
MNLKNYTLNTIQSIAITGLVISFVAQIGLLIVGREINHFWYLYPSWVIIFGIGALLKQFAPAPHDHDHHH